MTLFHRTMPADTALQFLTDGLFAIEAHQQAAQLFEKAFRAESRQTLSAWMKGENNRLAVLDEKAAVFRTAVSGRQTVPLSAIKGSMNDVGCAFDAEFRPSSKACREAWVAVAETAVMGQPLTPVELVKFEDAYYVVSGHDVVSVLTALGRRETEAIVAKAMDYYIYPKTEPEAVYLTAEFTAAQGALF